MKDNRRRTGANHYVDDLSLFSDVSHGVAARPWALSRFIRGTELACALVHEAGEWVGIVILGSSNYEAEYRDCLVGQIRDPRVCSRSGSGDAIRLLRGVEQEAREADSAPFFGLHIETSGKSNPTQGRWRPSADMQAAIRNGLREGAAGRGWCNPGWLGYPQTVAPT